MTLLRSIRDHYAGRDAVWWFSHLVLWLICLIVAAVMVNLVVPL